ncbi:MAG: hypothetical protein ACREAM_16830 [Blastocatellia bacterium]
MNKKKHKLSDSVSSFCDGYWEWFERSETPPYEITGKYLFFSVDRDLLIETAVEELENGGFHQAKTHMADMTPPTGEYVLCLYYKDDSRKDELAAKYRNRSELKYRYWKGDEDTLAGKYSKEFLDKLSPAERNPFQRNHGK